MVYIILCAPPKNPNYINVRIDLKTHKTTILESYWQSKYDSMLGCSIPFFKTTHLVYFALTLFLFFDHWLNCSELLLLFNTNNTRNSIDHVSIVGHTQKEKFMGGYMIHFLSNLKCE